MFSLFEHALIHGGSINNAHDKLLNEERKRHEEIVDEINRQTEEAQLYKRMLNLPADNTARVGVEALIQAMAEAEAEEKEGESIHNG